MPTAREATQHISRNAQSFQPSLKKKKKYVLQQNLTSISPITYPSTNITFFQPAPPSSSSEDLYTLSTTRTTYGLIAGLSYAHTLTTPQPQPFPSPSDHFNNLDLTNQIDHLKTADLDLFLRIISLIQKNYTNALTTWTESKLLY